MVIKFHDISFSYTKKEKPLIEKLSFEAAPGKCIAIKGSSGSGKTTIYRLLLGFEKPDKGQILFAEREINYKNIHELRQQTAWLPQDLDLGKGIVKDVFYYPFEFKINSVRRPSEKTALKILAALGLSQKSWLEKFENLSTGQRQRVGIGICHLLQKPILLLDEPTSALDNDSKEKVADLLIPTKERTIISTSHDPWWLERCDKVIDLNG